MRNFINFVIVMMLMVVSNSAMAGTPNVKFSSSSITVDGNVFSLSDFYMQEDGYEAIKTADFVFTFPVPELSGSKNGGDCCEFIQFENGETAIYYNGDYWIIRENGLTEGCLSEYEGSYTYLTRPGLWCGQNPWDYGEKYGYFFANKNNRIYVILYGKK